MEEYGLVLCGGGGRGAYQIGVWRALKRLGLRKHITAVSGASVGALNAAMFASISVSRAADIWGSIRNQDIANPADAVGRVLNVMVDFAMSDDREITAEMLGGVANMGLFSRNGLIKLIEQNSINRLVCSAEFPAFVCCHNTDLGAPEYFDMRAYSPQTVTKLLVASSALPSVFPPEQIGGYSYRDGGLSDNIPVKPLYDIGYRNFIIAYLDGTPVNRRLFPDARFIELFPSDRIYLGDRNRSVLSNGTLDFSGENAKQRIELGEQETEAFFLLMGGAKRMIIP